MLPVSGLKTKKAVMKEHHSHLIILIEESSIGINQCGNLLKLCVDKLRLTVQLLTLTV